ncbi:hypothetical protein HOP50_07g49990 [Chloropicon primus]|uniref:Uncharacterized protein n=1 Tax=Chloropicon primus TaxID=1764295 RepID=A0A5B8MP54_9CHLO|nr:hypothetical protein A3770_07p49760 [Chloropicon primus]UPR01677.1 hypothetical protein HOP50_07g49990 [Chloropicon primus]|eukprot:QDZ22458.1 hypothetical protein A3770_07p49760 [Chloropicon primus]
MSEEALSRAVVPPPGKCIDPKHAKPCWVCKPLSSADKDSVVRLVDRQGRSGCVVVELLREQVGGTIEWNSDMIRDRVREKHPGGSLGAGVGTKDLSLLGKGDLLLLCREWGFRSDLWSYPSPPSPSSLRQSSSPSSQRAAAPLASPPQPSTSALRRSEPRCIDPSHSQPCQVCLPAPSEDEEHRFQLVGDPGRKNGEKKLRKFIQMTPEWNSTELRKKLGDKFKPRPDLGTFSKVVANKEAANLRKPHLVRLCREWGFKSNIWQPKKAKQPKRGAGAAPSSAPRDAQPQAFKGVQMFAEVNDLLTNVGRELLRSAQAQSPGLASGDPMAMLSASPLAGSATKVSLKATELQAMFKESVSTAKRAREMFALFCRLVETHLATNGVRDIDVITLISKAQEIALTKMKLDASKAHLLQLMSQLEADQAAKMAMTEMPELFSAASILSEAERSIHELTKAVTKVLPTQAAGVLHGVLLEVLVLFTSCQSLAALARFCSYGMYLDSLIFIYSIFSDFDEQVMNNLHHAIGKILNHMVSTSSVSPVLQNTIQSLLVTNSLYNPASYHQGEPSSAREPGRGEGSPGDATPFQGIVKREFG